MTMGHWDWTGPVMLIVLFSVSHFNFLLVPCGGLCSRLYTRQLFTARRGNISPKINVLIASRLSKCPPFSRPWKLRTFSKWKIPINMQSRKFTILLSMIIIIIINICGHVSTHNNYGILLEACELQRFRSAIPLSEGLIQKVKWPTQVTHSISTTIPYLWWNKVVWYWHAILI